VCCGAIYNLCIAFTPWISREQMLKESEILYKVLNCSKFLADADLLCGKAAVLGNNTIRQFILLLLVVLSPTPMSFWGLWHSVLPVHLCLRMRQRVWLHEMLVSAGPVVLDAYVPCNKFYHSCRNSNPSYFMGANVDLGGCVSLMTSLRARWLVSVMFNVGVGRTRWRV